MFVRQIENDTIQTVEECKNNNCSINNHSL